MNRAEAAVPIVQPPKLRRRYFWFLAGFVTLLLLLTSVPEAIFAFSENKARIAELQSAEARLAANRVAQFLDFQERLIAEVDALPWKSGVLTAEDRVAEYERVMKLAPAIMELEHLDGIRNAATRVSRTGPNFVNTEVRPATLAALEAAKGRDKWYSPTYLREGNVPFVNLARPSADGGTVAQINLQLVTDVVAELRFGQAGSAYVVDSANKLVAHPNLSLVLRNLDVSGSLPARPRAEVTAPNAGSALAPRAYGVGAAGGVFEAAGIEGGQVLRSAVYLDAPGWWVVVEQPVSEALSGVFTTLWRTVGFLLLGLLLAFAASYLLARMLAAPIISLQRGAARIGQGDLSARIDVKTGDEIEALASEFNQMAEQLEAHTTGLELKVSQKTAQLERANRHKSEFLANMSHELRTPLNAIIGFSEALNEQYFGELNPKQREYVRDINGSGQHLLSLINDILDLSKIEAGRMDLDLTRFNLPAAIDNALVLVRERAHQQGLRLSARVAPELDEVVADERKFKQILINLLTNAVKFSHPNGWVEVVAERDKTATVITVRDSGIGIAPADQDAIFEEFHQLKATGSAKAEGTGLGLSLVKRLVELHGGQISLKSALGEGAAFSFSLPDRPPPAGLKGN